MKPALTFTAIALFISGFLSGQDQKTITVRGTAVQEIDPEVIELRITFHASDNLERLKTLRVQESNLQRVMDEFGILQEDLVVDDLSARGWGVSKIENTNITITKTYRLKMRQPAMVTTILPRIVEMGADNVSVVHIESAKLDSVKQTTLLQAIDNAKEKANQIASRMGVQLGHPVSVTEMPAMKTVQSEGSNEYNKFSGVAARGGTVYQEAEIQTLTMRKIRVVATYEVIYELLTIDQL